jgi:hypothetical protein
MTTPEAAAAAAARAAPEPATNRGKDGMLRCWCCGQLRSADRMIHLGSHPEVAVCLACAHFLHQRARAREDELHPSLASRGRDVLRAGRQLAMRRGWHHAPGAGRVLRWAGRRLP